MTPKPERLSDAVTLYEGDCLEVLKTLAGVDVVITDPPYGCGKAGWDMAYPTEWYSFARGITNLVCIVTGSAGLRDSLRLVGDDLIDVVSGHNLNGMTRGPIGFGNWLAAVIACGKPRQGPNAFQFTVRGEMPDHPSPKPIEYMRKLVRRITEPNETILDPFAGSGTTAIAAMQEGRRCILIERDPHYCEIIRRRVREADGAAPGTLFREVARRESLFADEPEPEVAR